MYCRSSLCSILVYFLIAVLTRAASDDSIKIVALTGAGDYFSSGNDLSNFIRPEVCQNVKDSDPLHFFHENSSILNTLTLFSRFFKNAFPIFHLGSKP